MLSAASSDVPVAPDHAPAASQRRSDVFRTTAWLGSDQAVQALVALAVGVIVTRELGPSRLGDLSFALAITAILTPFVVSYRQVMVRDLVREPHERAAILGSGAVLGLAGAAIGALAGITFAFAAGGNDVQRGVVAVSVAGLFGVAISSCESALQTDQRGRELALVRTGSAIIGAASKVGLVVAGLGALGFATASSAQSFVGAGAAVVVVRRASRSRERWTVDRARLGRLCHDSWPFAVSAVAIAVYMTIDQVMLGLQTTAEEVGLYAAAVRLSEATLLLPMVVIASVSPLLAQLHRDDPSRYLAATVRLVRTFTAVSVVIAVVGGSLAGIAISVLLGDAFTESRSVLMMLLVANVFVFQTVATSAWIVNEGLQRAYMVRTLSGAALNVLLNLYMIPRYGGDGAAVSTLVAYAYVGVIGTAIDRRTRPLASMILASFTPRSIVLALRYDLANVIRRTPVDPRADSSEPMAVGR